MFLSYQKMDQQKSNDLKELTLEKSRKVVAYLKSSSNLAEHLATLPEIINLTENPTDQNVKDALKLLNNYNINGQYATLYILDASGKTIVSTDAQMVGNNYSFRPYFQKAIIGNRNMYVSIAETNKAQGYHFAEPIKDSKNNTIGVLALKLLPDEIYAQFDKENKNSTSHLMITDQFGIILYSDLKEKKLSSLGVVSDDILTKIKAENKFLDTEIKALQYQIVQDNVSKLKNNEVTLYKIYDKIDKSNEIISAVPISGYPLLLISENSSKALEIDAIGLATTSGTIILISKLLILILIFLLISKNLKPLKDLDEMAKSVIAGNLEVKNNIKSGDEIEDLGISFSKMTAKLKEYYSDLEDKVADRTKELNIKNEYLNNTKLATLNILDDIQDEKNKTVILAKDLEKFKLALDNASDHVVITDADGITLYCNSGVERITGYTREEALGKKAGTLWAQPMPKEFYEKLWKTIKTDKKPYDGSLKNKRKNGELYDAQITISPVLNDKSEVEFFIGIERDITHEKMVDQAKTEFVSLASHQLRTPLSSVNWYAEMLLAGDGGKLNDEQTTFVKEIYTGNQRMVALVNSLLNVSRLELGTFAVEPEPTDVVQMAADVIKELQPSIISKKLKVTFEHADGIPIIQADPKLFRIVYQNLLSNAVKYTPDGGSVALKLNKTTKNLLIEVTDTGYGIPKSEQSKIFQKLFRAENVREKDTEGTGLGLYIVKSIIDHAEGKISFKSTENKGTTFNLEIPLSGMKKKEGAKKLE
jgi:PAS domain S-box